MGIDITGLGSVAELVTTTINKVWPDKTEIEKAQLAAAVSIVQGQLEVNKEEAKSSSAFVAGGRPFIIWVCGTGLAMQFVVFPTVVITASWFNKILAVPSLDMATLMTLLFGLLGLSSLRSFDKVKGVAS